MKIKFLKFFDEINNFNLVNNIGSFIQKTITRYYIPIAFIAFCAFTFFYISFAVDDGFIHFRYAENLKKFGIWNWNPNSTDLIEAYTGGLYVLILIIPFFLNIPAQVFLDLFALVILFLLIKGIVKNTNDNLKSFSLLFLLVLPTTYIHFYSGLETPVFIFLLFELFRNFEKIWNDSDRKVSRNYFYFLLVALVFTRSEGAVVSSILFFALLLKERFRIYDFKFMLIWFGIGLSYFVWRYNYFGHLFPAPIYHKFLNSEGHFKENINSGLLYLFPLLILLTQVDRSKIKSSLVILISVLFLGGMYMHSRLEMNYADRFFYQIFLPTILFLFTQINFDKIRYKNIFSIALLLFLLSLIKVGIGHKDVQQYSYSLYNSYVKVGEGLGKFRDKGYKLFTGDCGALPYLAGFETYDDIGIANIEVAKKGVTKEFLQEKSPDIIIIYSAIDGRPSKETVTVDPVGMKVALEYINDDKGFEYIDSFTSGNYYNAIFIRKNLSDYKELKSEIIKQSTYTKDLFHQQEPFAFGKIIKFILSGVWLKI